MGGLGVGVSMGVWGCPMHVCMHMNAHICMFNMINMDASMLVAICNFYTCIHVHACMCMCVHACEDTPMSPDTPRQPHPPAPSPELQGAQNTKIQYVLD